MDDDERLASWRNTITFVMQELTDLTWQRREMCRFVAIVESNPALINGKNTFPFDVNRWFWVYGAMAIRRLADTDNDTHSLRWLLGDMRAHVETYRRDDLRAVIKQQYRTGSETSLIDWRTDNIWDDLAAEDGLTLDRKKIGEDISALCSVSQRIAAFATYRLAHFLKRSLLPQQLPNDDELDSCIDEFARIATRYSNLLHGASMSGDLDGIEQYDWYEIWRFPWKPQRDGDQVFVIPRSPVIASRNTEPVNGLTSITVHRPATKDCADCMQMARYWSRDAESADGTFVRHVAEVDWDGDGHGVTVWTIDDPCFACSRH